MITIKCAECGKKLFKYIKIGEGRVLRLYKNRIVKDFSTREGNTVKCHCGNIIGRDEGRWIKLRQSSFTYTGRVIK